MMSPPSNCPVYASGDLCTCSAFGRDSASCPYNSAPAPAVDTLTNPGIIELNPAPLGPRAVTIVTGLGRSGTSMAAHILDASGISMGERKDDVVYEDNDFGDAIRVGSVSQFETISQIRDGDHLRWGFKATSLHDNRWTFDLLDDVRMVVMSRDPIAIACRAAVAHKMDAAEMLPSIAADSAAAIAWAFRQRCPVLLCSYEKAIAKPREFTQRLVEFAGGDTTNLDALAALVEPERPHYVQNARVP